MNVLFVTGHPAQIHHFKNVKSLLELKGNAVFWASSAKEVSFELLKQEGIEYIEIQRSGNSFWNKLKALLVNNWKLNRFIRQNRINVVISRVSPFVSLTAKWNGVFHIGISDTEKSGIYDSIFTKMLDTFITSDSFNRNLRKDQIRIKSNTELYYLHRNYFKPNENIIKSYGIQINKPYSIVRFVSWNAYHDKGQKGFSKEFKLKLIKRLEKYSTVFISSEGELPAELESNKLNIPPYLMHDLLNFASLYIGEGASMAAEASLLGTPSILVNDIQSGNGEDLIKHNLLHHFTSNESDQREAIQLAEAILKNNDSKANYKKNLDQYLEDKIDASAFLAWFIENGSKAKSIMIHNPEYQNKFR